MIIDLLPPDHSRVQSFIDGLFNHPTLVPAAAILFGGDRWYGVEIVGVLSVGGADAGICSLCHQQSAKKRGKISVNWLLNLWNIQ